MPNMPNDTAPDGTALVTLDPWLTPYADRLRERFAYVQSVKARIDAAGGLLGHVSDSYGYLGFNRGEEWGKPGVWYREWAPGANYVALVGDFNGWDRGASPCKRDDWGVWTTFLADDEYSEKLMHGSKVAVYIEAANRGMNRIPAYIRRAVQDETTHHFTGQYWNPPTAYEWRHDTPPSPEAKGEGVRIYEAHVGMAQEEGKVGTFTEFTENILPRIQALGYNAVQLMGVMEHPYYGSFGYHVSNFYAVSSRFGTPEELKALVDTAHGMGLRVIMDVIHSHAVKNLYEGLNHFDGTEYQYFHAGERGQHPAWDSLLFDYAKFEVQRFLLSNVRFWLDEYRFDGFRFDGVTSMLYRDHGIARVFSSYDDYFGDNIDRDALAYLCLANELTHTLCLDATTIAEDVSGMPGMARPVANGGLGFDYRLAMGVPDYWIELVKDLPDEAWSLGAIYSRLLDRRRSEPHIGYAESHDQALVGDKTLAFRLMDAAMYFHMERNTPDLFVDRGLALHKIIRLLTFSLGGEGWLGFMGNEFGHPEWIDFPREGNDYSYAHARRQWSLVDNPELRYSGLNRFDAAMQQLDVDFHLLRDSFIEQLFLHEHDKVLAYRRGPLVFVVNLHPSESWNGIRIPVPDPSDYRLVLNTDDTAFEGHGHVAPNMVYPRQASPLYGRNQSIQLYLPSRSMQVLAPVTNVATQV